MQSSLILPALLQAAWSHWTFFSGFFPLKHTSRGTSRVFWVPARATRSCYSTYRNILPKVPNQGTWVGCAFLCHIHSKSSDAAVSFRSVQSLNWSDILAGKSHPPECQGSVLLRRVHLSTGMCRWTAPSAATPAARDGKTSLGEAL